VDDFPAISAIPAHAVQGFRWTALLQDDAHCIRKAHRIVGGVGREQEHVPLSDDDVPKITLIHDLEHHGTLVLVEPLGRLVDVIIRAGVGPADDLASALVVRRRVRLVHPDSRGKTTGAGDVP
jgi:hypothetical protein